MGISSLYILDLKGRILISRAYRADVPANANELYQKKVLEMDELSLKPIIYDEENQVVFIHLRYQNLIFLATIVKDVNVVMASTFLHRLIEVFKGYFTNVEEESVRDNFVIIYELLDEMMDNGYPQTTDFKILNEYIKSDYHKLSDREKKNVDVPPEIEDVVNWRKRGIKHKKNQIYLDVIETLNMTVTTSGQVIKSEVVGKMAVNCNLSGMPMVNLGLNDKVLFELNGRPTTNTVEMEDIKFHHCVKLAKFEADRSVIFIPPDGEFDLMSYRVNMAVKPLFYVDIQHKMVGSTKLEIALTVKALFKNKTTATDVEIHVPIPPDAFNPDFNAAAGVVSYYPDNDSIIWQIPNFVGEQDIRMKTRMQLPTIVSSERDNYKNKPLKLTFEIPYFTVSGINVRYVKVTDESGYEAVPWVRYMTQSGEYFIRH